MAEETVNLDYIENGDAVADEIAHLWERWDSNRKVWKDRAKEVEQYLYATSTRETANANIGGLGSEGETNLGNSGGWSHSTHIPKITQIYDNLGANYLSALFPNENYFTFASNDEESEDKRDNVIEYIKTKNRLNDFEGTQAQLIDDWIVYGNCFALVTYEANTHNDPNLQIESIGYRGPKIYRISPYDIVFNPIASSFSNSPKIIRELKTIGEISLQVQENPEYASYSQEVIDLVEQNRAKFANDYYEYGEEVEKATQIRFDGFGSLSEYFMSGYVELLHLYGDIYDPSENKLLKNHVVTIVDRKFVVRKAPIPTLSGKPHIYHCPWRRRRDNLWGMGPLDNLVGMQFYINHLENARADAFDRMIYPDYVIEGDVTEPEDYTAPMKRFYVDEAGQGQVYPLTPDTTILQADFEIQNKAQEMEEYAGAPKQAMGIRTPGEKTKFEVSQLMNAASRIFQHKIHFYERNFLEPILNAELELSQRYASGNDIVQVLDERGAVEFKSVTRDDILANGKLVPMGARHFEKKAQDMQNLVQIIQIVESSPSLAQHFPGQMLSRAIEDALDYNKFDLYQPYGRLYEQAEQQQILQTIQRQLAEMSQIGREDQTANANPAAQGSGGASQGPI